MAQIYELPSAEDRYALQGVISIFLHTQDGRTRQIMLKSARAILDRYNVSHINFENFIVRRSREPGWAVIAGKRQITGDNCPGCGASVYEWPGKVRILSWREGLKVDTVSYGCSCGRIFVKKEEVL